MNQIHLFAGGNTSQGFYSCFEHILPAAQRRRMFYLKGGPGVGKSTMMKRMAAAAQEMGLTVTCYHCSSDPDSLDGVALPQLGWAMLDGTAPHVYDPVIPGARDTLVSLGDGLRETEMRPKKGVIGELQQEISRRFARCYRFLAAAGQLFGLMDGTVLREDAVRALAHAWMEQLPLRGGRGSCRRMFATAYTPKGVVDILPVEGLKTVWVECPVGSTLTPLWREVGCAADWRGLEVVHLLHPLLPEELEGVLLPGEGMLFRACAPGAKADAVAWQQLMDVKKSSEQEQSYDSNAYELMLQRALEQLTTAKALHDELEKHYAGHMDFLDWQAKLDRILEELRRAQG